MYVYIYIYICIYIYRERESVYCILGFVEDLQWLHAVLQGLHNALDKHLKGVKKGLRRALAWVLSAQYGFRRLFPEFCIIEAYCGIALA